MGSGVLRSVWLGTVPYREAWALQRKLAAARRRDEIDDCVLLLEHPPVYTMGRNGKAEHVPGGEQSLVDRGADYVDIDRGGSVTFHGPGQLVAYPIVRVAELLPTDPSFTQGDVVQYVRVLERVLCDTAAAYGVTAGVRPPFTGVWVGERKLAAIGVKVAGGVSTHGIALNVTTDLTWFSHVIACGIAGVDTTSLKRETNQQPSVEDVAGQFMNLFCRAVGRQKAEIGAAERAVLDSAPATAA